MSDTLTGHAHEASGAIPDYPMARAAGCPLAPAPVALELNVAKQLSRARIWAALRGGVAGRPRWDLLRPRGLYETAGGGVTFAKVPLMVRSTDDNERLWQLSEHLTGVSFLP
jgi:hypothetical protein